MALCMWRTIKFIKRVQKLLVLESFCVKKLSLNQVMLSFSPKLLLATIEQVGLTQVFSLSLIVYIAIYSIHKKETPHQNCLVFVIFVSSFFPVFVLQNCYSVSCH